MDENARSTKAGDAFAALLAQDPIAKEAWHRVQSKMFAVAQLSKQANLPDFLVTVSDEFLEISEDFSTKNETIKRNWEKEYRHEFPESQEDYLRWCTRLGMSADTALKGEFSEAELFAMVEGFLLKQIEENPKAGRPKSKQVADRRNKVHQLKKQGMKPGCIAAELKVSVDVVKKDLNRKS